MPHVRPATLADLDTVVTFNLALTEKTERLRLDPATLRQGVVALAAGDRGRVRERAIRYPGMRLIVPKSFLSSGYLSGMNASALLAFIGITSWFAPAS